MTGVKYTLSWCGYQFRRALHTLTFAQMQFPVSPDGRHRSVDTDEAELVMDFLWAWINGNQIVPCPFLT